MSDKLINYNDIDEAVIDNAIAMMRSDILNYKMSTSEKFNNTINENKTFVLEKEEGKTEIVDWHVSVSHPVNLMPLFEKISCPLNSQFNIYYPQLDNYIPFEQICLEPFVVPEQYLELKVIMIRYSDYQDPLNESVKLSNSDLKKERSRERTIGEVVELLSKWRQLHTGNRNSKRMNLQESAKALRVSKKSLDDYYYQIRVGQKYEFKFDDHMDDKIGVLRSFIKSIEQGTKSEPKHSKVPKTSKLIEQFMQKLSLREQSEQPTPLNSNRDLSQNSWENNGAIMGNFWANPFESINREAILDCENKFLDEFRNCSDGPDDPFFLYFTNRPNESDNSLL